MNKSKKVLIINANFAKFDPEPIVYLKDHGFEVKENQTGRSLIKDEIIREIEDVEAIIVGVEQIDEEILHAARRLKIISKFGVGIDNIDLQTAKKLGISVTRTVGANADAVADTAFGLILAVAKRIPYIDNACRRGLWLEPETHEVNHKTLGLIGMGDIGKRVAKRARGFEMTLLAYDLIQDEEFARRWEIKYKDLKTVLTVADIISVHLPITSDTRNLIGKNEIGLMKKTSIIINTARGGIIDEEALIEALRNKRIFGAGLDVFVNEPLIADQWKDLDNVVLSSHCAADTVEATNRMSQMAAENIVDFFN